MNTAKCQFGTAMIYFIQLVTLLVFEKCMQDKMLLMIRGVKLSTKTHGAYVNGMQMRNTPLYYACASSRFGVVKKLLEWGASTNLSSGKLKEACKSRVDSRIADTLLVFKSNIARLKISGSCFLGVLSFHGSKPLCSMCKNENQLLVEKLPKISTLRIR